MPERSRWQQSVCKSRRSGMQRVVASRCLSGDQDHRGVRCRRCRGAGLGRHLDVLKSTCASISSRSLRTSRDARRVSSCSNTHWPCGTAVVRNGGMTARDALSIRRRRSTVETASGNGGAESRRVRDSLTTDISGMQLPYTRIVAEKTMSLRFSANEPAVSMKNFWPGHALPPRALTMNVVRDQTLRGGELPGTLGGKGERDAANTADARIVRPQADRIGAWRRRRGCCGCGCGG